jgi:hypothetical protein
MASAQGGVPRTCLIHSESLCLSRPFFSSRPFLRTIILFGFSLTFEVSCIPPALAVARRAFLGQQK